MKKPNFFYRDRNIISFFPKNLKSLLIMKLITLLLTVNLLSLNASLFSQGEKVNLSLKKATLKEAFFALEEQTNLKFLYSDKMIEDQMVSINARDRELDDVLKQVLSNTGNTYHFLENNLVVITPDMKAAQELVVKGVVKDSDGNSLPGVNIVEVGTTNGSVTNLDGEYTLSVSSPSAVLQFSYVGFLTDEVQVEGKSVIDVVLVEDIQSLEEVVVVGYGSQKKESLTGAISSVTADDVNKGASANAVQRIQGKVSGVTIVNSHTPGGEATVRVRGMGTINNNNPLYVIDGVPTKEGMSQLNPNDIESMTVLKDASSAAIYGARGANGVIIITTKKGKSGKAQISFNARVGAQKASTKYDLLNTKEYGELVFLEGQNSGLTNVGNDLYGYGSSPVIPYYCLAGSSIADEGAAAADMSNYSYEPGNYYFIVKSNQEGTDWWDEIFRTAGVQDYNLSITGGSETGHYAFSGGYYHEDGLLIHTSYDRYSLRSNAGAKYNDWLEVGENLGVVYSETSGNFTDNRESSAVSHTYRMQPIIPVYDEGGNFAGTQVPTTGNGQNPVAMLTRDKDDFSHRMRATGSFFAEATFLNDFKFKSLFGVDYLTNNTRDISRIDPETSEPSVSDALSNYNYTTLQWNWANTINYNKTINDSHNFNVIAGVETVNNTYRYIGASRSVFFSNEEGYMYLNTGESGISNEGSGSDWRTLSYFGRLNYDYLGRYLVEGTFRRDGSSRFGANNRWGNFPAFSLGWRLSDESFMAATSGWLDNLKLRFGWGMSGNDEIGDYNGFTTFQTAVGYSYYDLGGSNSSTTAGYESAAFGNKDAKWEATTTTNFGIDMGVLNNSLTFGVDIWQRITTDMLYRKAIADVVGTADAPYINIGEMKNRGIDITASYRNTAMGGDFQYNITANVSRYKNEIVKLTDNEDEFLAGGELRNMSYTRSYVGWEYPAFYGYEVAGIFQTQEEADAWAVGIGSDGTYNEPGHFKYVDQNDDGVIDDEDRVNIGSPHPDFYGGLNIDLQYKQFDLSAFFNYSYGNEMVNYVNRWINYNNFLGNRSKARLYESWGSPYLSDNSKATLAKAEQSDEESQYPSTHFLEDASYLRLKTLQLGYNLPNSAVQKLGVSSLRVYFQVTNLFTLTKYSGLDPEGGIDPDAASNGDTLMGIDRGAWPTPQQFMFGVSLNL